MASSTGTTKDGSIEVLTFKRGVLSRLAHDLKLRLGRFEVEVREGRVNAKFWPDSLEVMGVVHNGRTDATMLSPSQRSEIQGNIRDQILLTRRHPTIQFSGKLESTGSTTNMRGELEMVGRRVPLEFPVELQGQRVSGEVALQPTRWGIAPFKALMGAIQLEDRIIVRFDVPEPG